MSWARNGLALAPLRHEDTPLPWPDRQDRQHLQLANDWFAGHTSGCWVTLIIQVNITCEQDNQLSLVSTIGSLMTALSEPS